MMVSRAADEQMPSQPQGIKSIEVGARVLLALERGRGPMSLSGVAREAGLHSAKAHRYLASLVRSGLASQDPVTGLYDLGPAARQLGVEAIRRTEPVGVVTSHALELRDQTGHTINVAVWTESGPMLVRWDAGVHALPIAFRVGSVLPLLDSAVGLVFFAHLDRSLTGSVLREQQRQGTTRTATAAELRELKESTVTAGVSSTVNAMILGLSAIAAPVFGADRRLEVVIGLIFPSGLATARETRRLGGFLRHTAERASRELGFDDPS
jgi:DNA-binding IclR family transcriptional regulator